VFFFFFYKLQLGSTEAERMQCIQWEVGYMSREWGLGYCITCSVRRKSPRAMRR